MANNTQNYKNFLWNNQMIDDTFVKSVRVRIFRPLEIVTSDFHYELIDTDGKVDKNTPRSFKKHISNYSYVLLSTGIREKSLISECCSSYLYIKIYLTDNFDFSSLKNVNLVGKSYLLEALHQFQNESEDFELKLAPRPESNMLNYFKKKIETNYEEVYALLKSSAQNYDIDKVEQLFKNYKISSKYQALFWKKMYQETNSKK